MEISDISRKVPGGYEMDVMVSPKASNPGIAGIDVWRKCLIIRVQAPPVKGKANKEVEKIIGVVTGTRVTVVSGHTSRQKTVRVEGDPENLCIGTTKI